MSPAVGAQGRRREQQSPASPWGTRDQQPRKAEDPVGPGRAAEEGASLPALTAAESWPSTRPDCPGPRWELGPRALCWGIRLVPAGRARAHGAPPSAHRCPSLSKGDGWGRAETQEQDWEKQGGGACGAPTGTGPRQAPPSRPRCCLRPAVHFLALGAFPQDPQGPELSLFTSQRGGRGRGAQLGLCSPYTPRSRSGPEWDPEEPESSGKRLSPQRPCVPIVAPQGAAAECLTTILTAASAQGRGVHACS